MAIIRSVAGVGEWMVLGALLMAVAGCGDSQADRDAVYNEMAAEQAETPAALAGGEVRIIARAENVVSITACGDGILGPYFSSHTQGELVDLATGDRYWLSIDHLHERYRHFGDGEIYEVIFIRRGESGYIFGRDIVSAEIGEDIPPEYLTGMLHITVRIDRNDVGDAPAGREFWQENPLAPLRVSSRETRGTFVDIETDERYAFDIGGLRALLMQNGDVYDIAIEPPADGGPVTAYDVIFLKRRDDLSPQRSGGPDGATESSD